MAWPWQQLAAAQERLQLTEQALRAERDFGRQRERDMSSRNKKAVNGNIQRADSQKRMIALRNRFVEGYWPRAEDVKRFRVNTKKATTAAGEILAALKGLNFALAYFAERDRESLAGDIVSGDLKPS